MRPTLPTRTTTFAVTATVLATLSGCGSTLAGKPIAAAAPATQDPPGAAGTATPSSAASSRQPTPGAARSTRPAGQPSATAAGSPLHQSSTESADAPQCRSGQLSAEAGETQAMASTRTTVLQLTNTSQHRCTVTGYGRLALLDGDGHQLTTTLERAAAPTARTIALAPQGYTTRLISWRVVPTGPQGKISECVTGRSLLVVPPGSRAGLRVTIHITACDRGTLGAGAWTRDAG